MRCAMVRNNIANMGFRRKNIRLPAESYKGKRSYFITICCEKMRAVFAKEAAGSWVISWLARIAVQQDFVLHAYCVMPDHLHFLAEGRNDNCDLVRFVSTLKQQTGFAYQQKRGTQLWQTRYYDHVLRKPDDMDAVAWYIWLNPVRKGLCSAPQEYSLSGSLTVNWKDRCAPAHTWLPPWKSRAGALKPAPILRATR